MDELLYKLDLWKKHLEAKGLRVNMGKTKILICGKNLHSLKDSRKKTLVVYVSEGLLVIQSPVMDVNLGYTRNAVVLKVN